MTVKFYKMEDVDFSDFIDDTTELGQPVHVYQYQDSSDTYVIVSTNEIDEDDLENVFTDKITQYEIDEGIDDDEYEFDD
jgi:hypothetical protein